MSCRTLSYSLPLSLSFRLYLINIIHMVDFSSKDYSYAVFYLLYPERPQSFLSTDAFLSHPILAHMYPAPNKCILCNRKGCCAVTHTQIYIFCNNYLDDINAHVSFLCLMYSGGSSSDLLYVTQPQYRIALYG